ncbi:MAG: periplasmic heavy metal sensor [Sphingomonadaceae bacterium]
MRVLSLVAVAACLAAPALAQPAPPAPPAAPPAAKSGERHAYARERKGPRGTPRMFGNVSEEGRAVLSEAMRTTTPEDRAAVRAARDRVNALIAAERLDVPALRRAMEDERRLVSQLQARRQAALLEAVQKLSPADRKAFAEDAGKGRRMAEDRAAQWRQWAEEVRRRMADMPPPPSAPPPGPPPAMPPAPSAAIW